MEREIWELLEKKLSDVGEEPFFYKLKNSYEDVSSKTEKNRDKHFSLQKKIICTSAGASIANVIVAFCASFDLLKCWAPVLTALSSVLSILVTAFLAQKSMKKYSETWIRHQKHISDMEFEILEYVFEEEKYRGVSDKKNEAKLFEKEMLDIWKKNQSRFESNMSHFE